MSKRIPDFENEDEEREFWATHDSTEYINWKQAERVTFSNLKPSIKKISLRLPASMLEELKLLAMKDVPYQSLFKIFPGVCRIIAIFFQIEAFLKIKRSHMVDIASINFLK